MDGTDPLEAIVDRLREFRRNNPLPPPKPRKRKPKKVAKRRKVKHNA